MSNTIIIGAGRLGGTIARLLNNTSNVLVIDKDRNKIAKLQDFSGFIEIGDATDLQLLERVGIKDTQQVIAVTDDDNINIFIADVCTYLYAIPEICIRLKDSRKKAIVNERVSCICPFDLSLDFFEKDKERKESL